MQDLWQFTAENKKRENRTAAASIILTQNGDQQWEPRDWIAERGFNMTRKFMRGRNKLSPPFISVCFLTYVKLAQYLGMNLLFQERRAAELCVLSTKQLIGLSLDSTMQVQASTLTLETEKEWTYSSSEKHNFSLAHVVELVSLMPSLASWETQLQICSQSDSAFICQSRTCDMSQSPQDQDLRIIEWFVLRKEL